tara:strand:- start:1009 stop:1773 length:765 start_codon:yes stop_codon:yes gene_type:complete
MELIILGCGSSLGSPWINNHWGNCDKKNKLNIRTRCSAFIKKGNLSVLIDSSPDIREQFIKNKIKDVDCVLYTHEHSDQTSGIFELRPFFWKHKKRIDIYADSRTLKALKKKYDFCFYGGQGYIPIMKPNLIKKKQMIRKGKNKIEFDTFKVEHGQITSTAYVFNKTAYLSDCSNINPSDLNKLKKLNYLIIDCLKFKRHPGHFNLETSIRISTFLKPKKTILTNLHTELDYNFLKKNLPKNILPAYDGMRLKI